MFRILIADKLPRSILSEFSEEPDIFIDDRSGISAEELQQIIADYEGLIVRSRTRVTADVLKNAVHLKVIGRAGAGVDNIDISEATRRGIVVMNTPGGNTIAATEHTIALMLAALRNIPQAFASMKQEQWDRKSFIGKELHGKTVGIIGLGKIGREVAKRLSAFETRLIGYDPILTTEIAERLGVELVSFNELLKNADIVTIHAPKIPETVNMINAENLKMCKKGVVIVNCARGGLVNESDLLEALNAGQVATATLDVFESEPPRNWELIHHPRVIATPHLGASTREAQEKVARQILQQMMEYFKRGIARNAVNFVSVEESLQPVIQPYFQLAQRLGTVFSQIRESRLGAVSIRFYGDVIELPVEPIAAHLIMGALKTSTPTEEARDVELINPVNAITVAREKGIEIEIVEKDHPLTSHTNLIACDFETESGEIHLAGTLYARNIYRLIEIDGFHADAELEGKMIIIENDDVPGIIGRAGTILGNHRLNIAHLSSGRLKDKKLACNIFNVEGTWDISRLREELLNITGVRKVHLVEILPSDEHR